MNKTEDLRKSIDKCYDVLERILANLSEMTAAIVTLSIEYKSTKSLADELEAEEEVKPQTINREM